MGLQRVGHTEKLKKKKKVRAVSVSYGFSNSPVWMWELDHQEVRVPKSWHFSIVLEETLESLLESLGQQAWTAKRSNESILKEINPEYSLAGLMLKLKLQYFGHLMQTAGSLEKILMLGKIEGRRSGQQRMRFLDGIFDSVDMNLGKLREMVRNREAWHATVHGVTKSQIGLGVWTHTQGYKWLTELQNMFGNSQ